MGLAAGLKQPFPDHKEAQVLRTVKPQGDGPGSPEQQGTTLFAGSRFSWGMSS